MKQLLQAINHCHALDIIHRDIKPENIMVTKDDQIRVIDFGLAAVAKKRTLTEFAGTPYYMAPEVIKHLYGRKSDIWSLGVILYTLTSGYLPFQGENMDALLRKITRGTFHFDHAEF
mmetsp:Transcript_42189/g.55580  ORF Transcript_42189/g.55580 Transcript_42189/m.55580 type:complete len:117 (+) Transcript_42189:503-853(+)